MRRRRVRATPRRRRRRRRRRVERADAVPGAAGDVGPGAVRSEAVQRKEAGEARVPARAARAAAVGGRGADAERDGDDLAERLRGFERKRVGGRGLFVESIG